MTWEEIERRIEKGCKAELWKCLFLDRGRIDELLAHVKDAATASWVYPLFVFVAYIGPDAANSSVP